MEVGILISELIRKSVIPLGIVALLILAFYPVCTKNGTCDYFMLWILVGWPFGIGKMFIWIMPKNFGLAGSLGVVALNLIIGGLIGGMFAALKVMLAITNFIIIIGKGGVKIFSGNFRTSCL